MNNNYNYMIVKILIQETLFDWKKPFNKSNISEAYGSGFFIHKHLIVTNSHVVENCKDRDIIINIPAIGKKTFNVKIRCIYPHMDIALLEILNYKSPYYFNMTDISKNIIINTPVITLGFPLGQEKLKLTKGIISGLDDGLIQTDAPINPGNSGGPLINLKTNKVIGINSSGVDLMNNIGYAVPIHRVIENIEMLLKGNIIYPPILDFNLSKINNNYDIDGLMIYDILKGGPTSKSKIKNYDILTSFDGNMVNRNGEVVVDWYSEKILLGELFKLYKKDDIVKIEFYRNNKKYNDTIKLEDTIFFKIRKKYLYYDMIDYCVLDGIVFMDLTLNHTNVNNILICNIKSKKDRIKNKIVISSIINLKIINNSIIKEGLILTKINNIPIIDINDIKNKIKDFMKNEYIELYFENKLKYRINIKDMIKNDKELSKNHKYYICY